MYVYVAACVDLIAAVTPREPETDHREKAGLQGPEPFKQEVKAPRNTNLGLSSDLKFNSLIVIPLAPFALISTTVFLTFLLGAQLTQTQDELQPVIHRFPVQLPAS